MQSNLGQISRHPAFLDHTSFGSLIENRSWNAGSGYRYGFNGQEGDAEVLGSENLLDYKYRKYDPRIVRMWSIDPIASQYPMLTPYQHSSLNPIWNIELEGLEGVPASVMEFGYYIEQKVKNAIDVMHDMFTIDPPVYIPNRNSQGQVVVDNTRQAVEHYYRGGGESVELGSKTKSEIRGSEDMNYYRDRIVNGKTSNPASGEGLPVNMTIESAGSYHVGRTTMSYSTTCQGEECKTTYTIDGDGFRDIFWGEDLNGPDGELGGTPYNYNTYSWSETYTNPGYEVGDNGVPAANKEKVEAGEGAPNQSNYSSSSIPLQSR